MSGDKKVAGRLSTTRLVVRAFAPHPRTPAGATAVPIIETFTALHGSARIALGITPARGPINAPRGVEIKEKI